MYGQPPPTVTSPVTSGATTATTSTTAPPAGLPVTGGDVAGLTVLALPLLIIGAALLHIRKRA